MITAIIIAGIVLGACVFAACAAAPHCEPAELHEANESERAALRREAEEASRAYHVCGECNAERHHEARFAAMDAADRSGPIR